MPKCISCGRYTKYNNRRCSSCYKKANRTTFTTKRSNYPRSKKTGEYMHRKALSDKIGKSIPKGHEVHHRDGNISNWRKDNVVSLPKNLHRKITKFEKGMSPEERKKNSGNLLKRLGKRIWR